MAPTSYFYRIIQGFCTVLGKNIEHIPSTHNKEEKDKFVVAKKRTAALYVSEFGLQPKEFWEFNSLTEALKVKKSNADIVFYSKNVHWNIIFFLVHF